MSKELDTFDKWWMMQSKIPYRDKKEIAQSAWNQSRTATLDEVKEAVPNMERYDTGGMLNEFEVIKAIDNLRGDK